MKRAVAAILTVTAGLFAANMLGVAVAEAPTGTSLRTMSVQGVATVPIGQSDNAASATAVYRQGMALAVADGQSKAEFLTGKVGATLGTVQSVIEGGGYINCYGGVEGLTEYEGEQPDFGSAPQPGVSLSTSAAPSQEASPLTHRAKAKRPKRKHHPKAKKAATASCTLTAQVSLIYTIA